MYCSPPIMSCSYSCFYLTRNSLTYTAPAMVADASTGIGITEVGGWLSGAGLGGCFVKGRVEGHIGKCGQCVGSRQTGRGSQPLGNMLVQVRVNCCLYQHAYITLSL